MRSGRRSARRTRSTRVRTSLTTTFTDTHKKYVVYLDTPVASDKCGVALSGLTQTAYPGASAVVFLQPTATRNCLVGGLGTGAYPAMVVFHELIHTLQPSPSPTRGRRRAATAPVRGEPRV